MRKDLFHLIYVISTTEESPQFGRGPHGEWRARGGDGLGMKVEVVRLCFGVVGGRQRRECCPAVVLPLASLLLKNAPDKEVLNSGLGEEWCDECDEWIG